MESTPQSQGTLLVYTFTCFFLHCFLDVLVVNASVREDRHPSTRQVSQLWAIERPDSHLF